MDVKKVVRLQPPKAKEYTREDRDALMTDETIPYDIDVTMVMIVNGSGVDWAPRKRVWQTTSPPPAVGTTRLRIWSNEAICGGSSEDSGVDMQNAAELQIGTEMTATSNLKVRTGAPMRRPPRAQELQIEIDIRDFGNTLKVGATSNAGTIGITRTCTGTRRMNRATDAE